MSRATAQFEIIVTESEEEFRTHWMPRDDECKDLYIIFLREIWTEEYWNNREEEPGKVYGQHYAELVSINKIVRCDVGLTAIG